MKGDFTRFTYEPGKHYSGVLKQQGRVDLDADWNEYVQIRDYLNRTETQDTIGTCGVPDSIPDGFRIERDGDDATRLNVLPGRIYVNGILCKLDEIKPLVNPDKEGIYLAYLDVWQRHITAVEDPELPEIALGGVDTTTRVKTEWQVRFEDVSDIVGSGDLDCKPFCCGKDPWKPDGYESTGTLAARVAEAEGEETVCEVKAEAGYLGLQNRLYRVEIHDVRNDGTVTFKWSRDNGAVVFPVQDVEPPRDGKSTVIVKQTGKDESLGLHVGDWVEILGDETELAGKSGTLTRIAPELDGTDLSKGIIVLEADITAHESESHLKIRRWDQKETSEITLTDGAIPIAGETYVPLEEGIEVCFSNGTYMVGDYWLIPARTKIRDVLWPKDGTSPGFESRHGTEHYFCALALIELGESWGEPHDCRRLFPPLTDIKCAETCCVSVKTGEDIRQAVDSAIEAGGGCICLCGGVHNIEGPLVLRNAHNLTIHGENLSTILHFHGVNEDGEGGIILRACDNVTIAGMFILGDGPLSLISMESGDEGKLTEAISLRGLTLFNRTVTDTDFSCAVRLGNAEGIDIESCRMVADIGIISRFGDGLPAPAIPEINYNHDIVPRGYSFGDKMSRERRDEIESKEETRLTLLPASGPSGTTVKVKGTGFTPSHAVEMRCGNLSRNVEADAGGSFQIDFVVPAGVAPGDYLVTATDRTSDRVVQAVFTVTGEAPMFVPELNYGTGVRNLSLKGSQIIYRYYGIWTLKSVNWHLADCDLRPVTQEWSKYADAKSPYRALLGFIDSTSSDGLQTKAGTAVKALIWRDCQVSRCHLVGLAGMDVWVWWRGYASGNLLHAGKYGFRALWLHDVTWNDNNIQAGGIGLSFAGSYRTRIENNTVRGAMRAVQNSGPADWLNHLKEYLEEIVGLYGVPQKELPALRSDANKQAEYEQMALWILMEESCISLGLDEARDRLQDFINTFDRLKDIPVLFLASADIYRMLAEKDETGFKFVMPLLALSVRDNDFEAEDAVILLQSFLPMGGMQITGNRIHTLTGQALQVKAVPVAVNPHVVVIVWRMIFEILPDFVRLIINTIDNADIPEEQKTAIVNFIRVVSRLLARWGDQSESILETDYRIENNNIRSQRTAIESNLFELAVQNNYITLQESPIASDELVSIIDVLGSFVSTQMLAAAMRLRSRFQVNTFFKSVDYGNADEMNRIYPEAAEASNRLSEIVTDRGTKEKVEALKNAADARNAEEYKAAWKGLGERLESFVDTCGIWVKGAGCRIIGNQVLVPMDADRRTWAQGGIRFWDDEGTPIWRFVLIQQVLKILKPDLLIPSLLSVTETLIDNNEILGGIGHGVEICGIKNMPADMGLADIKIRGNQIRDMAGAGIIFDEKSRSTGVDIEGNRILDCGTVTLKNLFAGNQGGLVVRNVANCRVHNNRIRCNSNWAGELALFAVNMQVVYGLTFTNNHIQHNETSGGQLAGMMARNLTASYNDPMFGLSLMYLFGAVRLAEAYGELCIQNNDILLPLGTGCGLLIGNLDILDNLGEWKKWMVAMESRRNKEVARKSTEARTIAEAVITDLPDTEVLVTGEQNVITNACIQGNRFESITNQPFIAFWLENLNELNFSGNNVRSITEGAASGTIVSAVRGVISNNILDTLNINQMSRGIIAVNSCKQLTIPSGAGGAGITTSLNIT